MKPKNVTLFAHCTRAGIGRIANICRMIMVVNEKNTEYNVFFIFSTLLRSIVLKCVTIFIGMSILNYGFGNVEP